MFDATNAGVFFLKQLVEFLSIGGLHFVHLVHHDDEGDGGLLKPFEHGGVEVGGGDTGVDDKEHELELGGVLKILMNHR